VESTWIDDLAPECDGTCCLKKSGLGKWSELCFYEVSGKNGVSIEFGENQDHQFECEFRSSINQIRVVGLSERYYLHKATLIKS